MSDKYSFPAVFHPEEEGFSVWFPDLPGCVTEGDSLEDAAKMAKEALGLHLYSLEAEKCEIPQVSGKYALEPGEFIVAVAAGINMSATLQEALKEKLDL